MTIDLTAIYNFINGKKTYLVATSALITLAVQLSGHTISLDTFIHDAVPLILAMTIHHGITSSTTNSTTSVITAIVNTVDPGAADLAKKPVKPVVIATKDKDHIILT